MNYAIDLHSNNFIVSKRNDSGKIITKKYYLTETELNNFKSELTDNDVIAIESTGNSYYFYDEMRPLVKDVKIINPARFKVIAESSSKTDKNDTKAILEFLEANMLPEINIPSRPVRDLRGLFSTYRLIVKHKSILKNRVHGLLKSNGILLNKSDIFTIKGIEEIKKLKFSQNDNFQVQLLLEQIDIHTKKVEEVKKQILSYSKYFTEELELLITIPGISLFMGLAILTDIGDINNFTSAKKLCSYFGIVPKVKSSNDKVWTGRITRKGRKIARSFLSQIIFHFIKSSDLYQEFYLKKKKEKGSGKAIVAMMRKLVTIIFHMLKKKEKYYYMQERILNNKLQEWLKIIYEIRKMDKNYLDNWERKIRYKYDIKYYPKGHKLKKIA